MKAPEDATTLVKLDARTGRIGDRHRFEDDITPRWMRDGLAGIGVGTGDDVVIGCSAAPEPGRTQLGNP